MGVLNNEQFIEFNEFFKNGSNHAERSRAKIPVLYDDGFDFNQIGLILGVPRINVYYSVLFIRYFGVDEYFTLSYEDIAEKVEEEHLRMERRIEANKLKGCFYYLGLPFTLVYYFLVNIKNVTIAFFTLLSVRILLLFESNEQNNISNENIVTFEKGAKNNFSLQINNVVIHASKTEERSSEEIVASSEFELANKIEKLINSNRDYTFSNSIADYLFRRAKKIKTIGGSKEAIGLYASVIAIYLIYAYGFKGGILTVTILGIAIAVNVNGCFLNDRVQGNNVLNTLKIDSIDINETITTDTLTSEVDSTLVQDEDDEPEIVTYRDYSSLVSNFFQTDDYCFALSAVGKKQKKFIYEYDKIEHEDQNYFVTQYDEKYYVHVVAYDDIREAAFQMHYINSNGIFNAKILETINAKGVLYAVVIGKFDGIELDDMCMLVDEWKTRCFDNDIEVGCYYNG